MTSPIDEWTRLYNETDLDDPLTAIRCAVTLAKMAERIRAHDLADTMLGDLVEITCDIFTTVYSAESEGRGLTPEDEELLKTCAEDLAALGADLAWEDL